jgi:uncharacterized protein DUF1515
VTEAESVERSLGRLLAQGEALAKSFEASETRSIARHKRSDISRAQLHKRLDGLTNDVVLLKSDMDGIQKTIRNEVRPTIKKVTAWENRGVGWLAAIGLVVAGVGSGVAAFWGKLAGFFAGLGG